MWPEYYTWAEFIYIKNLYQRLLPNHKFDIFILSQAYNNKKSTKDYLWPKYNLANMYSNWIKKKV